MEFIAEGGRPVLKKLQVWEDIQKVSPGYTESIYLLEWAVDGVGNTIKHSKMGLSLSQTLFRVINLYSQKQAYSFNLDETGSPNWTCLNSNSPFPYPPFSNFLTHFTGPVLFPVTYIWVISTPKIHLSFLLWSFTSILCHVSKILFWLCPSCLMIFFFKFLYLPGTELSSTLKIINSFNE